MTSVIVPDDLAEEARRVADRLNESTDAVLQLAIRAGLPAVGQQAPPPAGFFAEAYADRPQEWANLEEATAKWPQPEPE